MGNIIPLLLREPDTVDCPMAKKSDGGRGVFQLPFAEATKWYDPDRCGLHMCDYPGACSIAVATAA
jgi:hypothetical protein